MEQPNNHLDDLNGQLGEVLARIAVQGLPQGELQALRQQAACPACAHNGGTAARNGGAAALNGGGAAAARASQRRLEQTRRSRRRRQRQRGQRRRFGTRAASCSSSLPAERQARARMRRQPCGRRRPVLQARMRILRRTAAGAGVRPRPAGERAWLAGGRSGGLSTNVCRGRCSA